MELASGWNPTAIAVKLDADSEWFSGSHWWTSERENQRFLHVELPRAISRDQSLQLRMNLQQFPSATAPAFIPVVRTQSEVPCDQLIVLKRDLMTPDRRSAVLTGWSEIAPEDGPEWLQRTQISQSLKLDRGQWSLFSASSPAFLQLPETSSTPLFSARSEDRLVLEHDEAGILTLSESLSLQIEDISKPLSNLTFSTSSETSLNLWNWNVTDRPEVGVVARILSANKPLNNDTSICTRLGNSSVNVSCRALITVG